MTKEQAIAIVCDIAGRWGENIEESFPRRLRADDTDESLVEMKESDAELDDMKEVRDLWRAIELLQPQTLGGSQP